MEEISNELKYVYSSSLNTEIQVKVGSLEGLRYEHNYNDLLVDEMIGYYGLFQSSVSADLMATVQVFSKGRPLTPALTTSYKPFINCWQWNEWLTLPLTFSDLPRDAVLAFTIYDCAGASFIKPVGGTCVYFFGNHGELRQGLFDLHVWPSVPADPVCGKTPGILKTSKTRMLSLYNLMKKHRENAIPKIDWLDRLSFREMEHICDHEKKTSNEMYLTIEFAQVFCDEKPIFVTYYEEDSLYQFNPSKDVNAINDPDILQDNLVEYKHHKLSRSIRSRAPDKDAKPNSETRDALRQIVTYSSMKTLTSEEQDLLWKYRFYVSDQKKALVKFLKCVNWSLGLEVQQALDMMMKWAPIDTDDALLLLTPTFSHPAVRQYAINCLKRASDESLLLYFLQLVQALRYENMDSIINVFTEMQVMVATDGPDLINNNFLNRLVQQCDTSCTYLLSFLIFRACHNSKIANYFFWYLKAECEENNYSADKICEMYLKVLTLYTQSLRYGELELQKLYVTLQNQQILLDSLVELTKLVAKETGNRSRKTTKFQELLNDNSVFRIRFYDFEPIPFPLDPAILVKAIKAEKAMLFKSKLMPSRLTFLTTEQLEYVVIFKYGDDLRQDQLVLQVITLIDNLLQSENLDLKLTPYKVLATSTKHGLVQYVHSYSIAEILSTDGTLQAFFRKHHPSKTGAYGISSEVMDTYIKSCAGYCVITYLLGVGDRHLDNLMVTLEGNLFHIDFGYILGRDPKPLPPPMKLSKEMVETMGGLGSEHYSEFRKQCFTAFLILRRHADLMLNLFSLMADANIPDIALEPDKAVRKIEDKLCLELGDEEAVQHFQGVLDSSVADIMAALVDQLHKLTQYYRN